MARGSEKRCAKSMYLIRVVIVIKVVMRKKMSELINVVTGIRMDQWEKMLKIKKRSATFIRYWRVSTFS